MRVRPALWREGGLPLTSTSTDSSSSAIRSEIVQTQGPFERVYRGEAQTSRGYGRARCSRPQGRRVGCRIRLGYPKKEEAREEEQSTLCRTIIHYTSFIWVNTTACFRALHCPPGGFDRVTSFPPPRPLNHNTPTDARTRCAYYTSHPLLQNLLCTLYCGGCIGDDDHAPQAAST